MQGEKVDNRSLVENISFHEISLRLLKTIFFKYHHLARSYFCLLPGPDSNGSKLRFALTIRWVWCLGRNGYEMLLPDNNFLA